MLLCARRLCSLLALERLRSETRAFQAVLIRGFGRVPDRRPTSKHNSTATLGPADLNSLCAHRLRNPLRRRPLAFYSQALHLPTFHILVQPQTLRPFIFAL
jgi:hypothetical protein